MKGQTIGVGALALAGIAIATDARSWLVGKVLDAITPEGGWSAAALADVPWGSIIGVPVFIAAVIWLSWETIGRATFRARFGTDRALSDYVYPLELEIIDARQQIKSLFSALSSIRDRERLHGVAREIEDAARPIYTLANDSGILSDGQEILLMQFEGEWENALAHWLSIARPYDEDRVDNLVDVPDDAFKNELPNAGNFGNADARRVYQTFAARMDAWRDARELIEQNVEDAAFAGKTLFKKMGGTLPVAGEGL